jgi:hypothetical protein
MKQTEEKLSSPGEIDRLEINQLVHLDKWDLLRCWFGGCVRLNTRLYFSKPVEAVNMESRTMIVSSSAHFAKKNKPDFGYEPKPESRG